MKVKCEYCGQQIDDSQKFCPACGAPMPTANRVAGGQPKTIEELKQWYIDHKLPPEQITRFFIGKDIKEPKAFGIYKSSTGDFVVYKNKSNGERVIRYQGTDEGYAVNELYQRLRSEIADQKANGRGGSNNNKNKDNGKKEGTTIGDIISMIILLPFVCPAFATVYIAIAIFIISLFDHSPAKGYYNYNGKDYYYQGSSWYSYDPVLDDWSYASNKDELNEIINSDTDNDYRTDYNEGKRFEDTNWYDSGTSDDDSDWDSDSSWWDSDSSWGDSTWDSGSSWDSGGSDWDSDW